MAPESIYTLRYHLLNDCWEVITSLGVPVCRTYLGPSEIAQNFDGKTMNEKLHDLAKSEHVWRSAAR